MSYPSPEASKSLFTIMTFSNTLVRYPNNSIRVWHILRLQVLGKNVIILQHSLNHWCVEWRRVKHLPCLPEQNFTVSPKRPGTSSWYFGPVHIIFKKQSGTSKFKMYKVPFSIQLFNLVRVVQWVDGLHWNRKIAGKVSVPKLTTRLPLSLAPT